MTLGAVCTRITRHPDIEELIGDSDGLGDSCREQRLSSNNRDCSRETASTACTRFREPVQPPATGEDRIDRTDARKGKIMPGSQRSHVTAMSPHAGTRQNGLAFRKLEANRINQIAAGVTGWIPIKRFRFPLALPLFHILTKIRITHCSHHVLIFLGFCRRTYGLLTR
jgi:hypothetical protein